MALRRVWLLNRDLLARGSRFRIQAQNPTIPKPSTPYTLSPDITDAQEPRGTLQLSERMKRVRAGNYAHWLASM